MDKNIKQVLEDETLSNNAKLLYLHLLNICGYSKETKIANEHLMLLIGVQKKTITSLLSQLDEAGYIRKNGNGTNRTYTVLKHL